MNGPDQDYEAELNAILNDGAEGEKDSTPLESSGQTEAAAVKEKISFGGREFGSWQELGQSYDGLLKDYSKKGNLLAQREKELQDASEAINWTKAIRQHKDLYDRVSDVIKNWNPKAQQNQPQGPSEVERKYSERLAWLEQREANRQLDAEIAELKNRYKLDNAKVSSVLEKAMKFAEQGRDIPLEDVFRIVSFDERVAMSQAEGEKAALEKLRRKNAANVGGSSAASVAPTAKDPSAMTSEEYEAALANELARYGYSS